MYTCRLPFGEPIFYEGEYKEDKVYNLYIQMIKCSFKIKKDHIPTIQIKNSEYFKFNEYLESSATVDEPDNEECLVLTSVDLKLFLDHYDVKNLKYIAGWKFKSMSGIFTEYIDKWITRKNEATLSGNKGQRTLAKLMLNALYGKFATSLDVQSKIPYLGEDDIVHYAFSEKDTKDGIYLPIGCFITAYAREKTSRTSQKIKEYSINKYEQDMYIYSDTDSIKTILPEDELKQFCEIDDIKLGAWKNEGIADKAKFVRQKCYLEQFGEEIQITCSGMPKSCYKYVEWKTFKTGFTCPRKANI